MRLAERSADFGQRPASSQLDDETPDQHARRDQLDQAVDPEREQRDRARGDPGIYRHAGLDGHPPDGKVFQAKRLPHERGAPVDRGCLCQFLAFLATSYDHRGFM